MTTFQHVFRIETANPVGTCAYTGEPLHYGPYQWGCLGGDDMIGFDPVSNPSPTADCPELVDRLRPTSLFAFSSISQMRAWFRKDALLYLHERTFVLATYAAISRHLLRMKKQCAFNSLYASRVNAYCLKDSISANFTNILETCHAYNKEHTS